eukprot:g2729.t1
MIKLVNQPPKEALEYAERLIKKEGGKHATLTSEQLLLGATAYTKSAIDYGKQTLSVIRDLSPALSNSNPVGIEERTTNGTIVTHLNQGKLDRCITHVLKIELGTIQNAFFRERPGNACKDPVADPFVVFTSGITMAKSKVARNQTDAEWNSTHYLFLRKHTTIGDGTYKFNIHVVDYDVKKSYKNISLDEMKRRDNILGSASFDIETQLKKHGRHCMNVSFDRGEANKDDQMKLDFYYELLTTNEYLAEINKTTCIDWFDNLPLETPVHNLQCVFAAAEVSPVTFRPLIYFNNKKTSTEGWVHADIKKQLLIVTFKGIDKAQKKDLQTQADSDRVFMESMAKDDYTLKLTDAVKNTENVKLHKGFLNAYESVRECLLETARSFCWDWDDKWLIVFTGESIGGALASIAAYEFANRTYNGKGVSVQMMSYGSPRVGNKAFIKSYADTVPVSYRFRYEKDLFTAFPRLLKHVPNMVKIKPDKTLKFIFPGPVEPEDDVNKEQDNEDDKTNDGAVLTNAIQTCGETEIHITFTLEVTIKAVFSVTV